MKLNSKIVFPYILLLTLLIVLNGETFGQLVPMKPYNEVVTKDAKTASGFFKIHVISGRYLFELPDSVLNRDLFSVNRIIRAAAAIKMPIAFGALCSYGGDWMGQNMFHFEKAGDNKIALKIISVTEKSFDKSDNGTGAAILKNNLQPISVLLPVRAIDKASGNIVIDMTDFLGTANGIFGSQPLMAALMPNGPIATDRSYIKGVKAFPTNIEIQNLRTLTMGTQAISYEFNNSIILLPKNPMPTRQFDARVGYFAMVWNDYKDFDGYPDGIRDVHNIWKWRLEPRDEDRAKYDRGELVEPKKQIVYYIDPNTPKKWIPYLIAGVNDWQKAFEKAGFKNAIIGKEAPLNDSTWSVDDARNNVIVYKASAISNATGNTVQDPRTGETLESHVGWYHSVMELLYKWYMVQAGAIDPRVRKPEMDDELMGQLIRFVSSHEIGHTLGLRHNWGASSHTPVEKLRDKAWVEANGHTCSIMDYARFNYVAQPEDGINEKGIFPRIGAYDEWAIEWGYRLLPQNTAPKDEKRLLNQMIVNKIKTGSEFLWGIERVPDPVTAGLDPRNQNEDLGDDAMIASTYGIKNLKLILPNLIQWTVKPGDGYAKAEELYQEIVTQYKRYMLHVANNISGLITNPKTVEQDGEVYLPIDKTKQKRAMAFLQRELFNTPLWLKDKKLYSVSQVDFSSVENVQKDILKGCLT